MMTIVAYRTAGQSAPGQALPKRRRRDAPDYGLTSSVSRVESMPLAMITHSTILAVCAAAWLVVGCKLSASEKQDPQENEESTTLKSVDGGKGRIVGSWDKRESGIVARRLNEFELSPERIARIKNRLPDRVKHRRRGGGVTEKRIAGS